MHFSVCFGVKRFFLPIGLCDVCTNILVSKTSLSVEVKDEQINKKLCVIENVGVKYHGPFHLKGLSFKQRDV